jgi:hypothetical protein
MKLEAGKRYVMADGSVTENLRTTPASYGAAVAFVDDYTFAKCGGYQVWNEDGSVFDIQPGEYQMHIVKEFSTAPEKQGACLGDILSVATNEATEARAMITDVIAQKKINKGVYGVVNVIDVNNAIIKLKFVGMHGYGWLTVDDIRDAASTLTKLADALDFNNGNLNA